MKIELQNVNKKFKENHVLKNINFIFYSGKIYGIRGINGSGKSVLLKLLCGFYNPTSGHILFNDKELQSEHVFSLRIRALIEKPSFFPYLSGYGNLKLLSKLEKIISDDDILKALKIVGLLEEKDKKFSKYSLGMKQKLGIAQAIMESSNLLLLDEPFNGLDAKSVTNVKAYLKKLVNEDKIIIITSHISDDLNELCNNIIEIKEGKIENEISV